MSNIKITRLKVGGVPSGQPLSVFQSLVEAGKYDSVYIPEHFSENNLPPLVEELFQSAEVNLLRKRNRPSQSGLTKTAEWSLTLDQRQECWVSPFRLLELGVDFPKEQNRGQLFTHWIDQHDLFWSLVLFRIMRGRISDRRLRIELRNPNDIWFNRCSSAVTQLRAA